MDYMADEMSSTELNGWIAYFMLEADPADPEKLATEAAALAKSVRPSGRRLR